MVIPRKGRHLTWRWVARRLFTSCDSFLLRPCPPCGFASVNDARHVEAVRRAPHKASAVRGGCLFLLLLAFFPTFQTPQIYFRDGFVQSREAGTSTARRGTQVRVVGALLTAAELPPPEKPTGDQLEKVTEDVCVLDSINYAPFILTAMDISSIPSTPKGSTPQIQHLLPRAIQNSRWSLSHQISAVASAVLFHVLSLEPPEPPERRAMKSFPIEERLPKDVTRASWQRRLAAIFAGPTENDDDDDDYSGDYGDVYDGRQPRSEGGPGSTPRTPLPPEPPLPLYDAVPVYLPFVAGYITLMALGAVVLVLAIPLLILLLHRPRCLRKSTGGFVNLLCFSAEACSVESLTERRQDRTVLDSEPRQKDPSVQGGVGSETKVGKGLSVLSEESMTQSGAEVKTTLEKGSLREEQDSEGNEADTHAAEEGAPLNRTGTKLYAWTGQNLGLGLLVTLLIAVLVCVSLGFGHTAHLSQALHAVHCALAGAFMQLLEGAEPGRQDVVAVLEQWSAKTLPKPEGPKDEDDYPPASPEYEAVLRNLLKAGSLPEDEVERLARRYDGNRIRDRERLGTLNYEQAVNFSAPHFRRLAAMWKFSDDEEGEHDGASDRDLSYLNPSTVARNVISFSKDEKAYEEPDRSREFFAETMSEWPVAELDFSLQDKSLLPQRPPATGSSFGGVRPLLNMVKNVHELTDSENSASFSSVSAIIFGKGLTAEHLLLSFYDHVTAIEMMLEANIYPPRGSGLFGHYSLARITALPFLRILSEQAMEGLDMLYNAEEEARKAMDSMLELERNVQRSLRGSDNVQETVDKIADEVASILNLLIQPRRVILPAILYSWGTVLGLLLVGTIMYLMYLNRQPKKVWESGEISPRPAGWLWWCTYVVGGATILLGAALLTAAVVSMDVCIYTATTLQEPHALQQIMSNKPLDTALDYKVDHVISACLGRTEARDLSGLVAIKDLRAKLRESIEKARRGLDDMRANQMLEDIVTIAPRILNTAFEHAGLFLFRADVRAHSEAVSPVVYYSGIQDETVLFDAFFDLPRAEFLGPPGVRRANLLRLPSSAPTEDDLKTVIFGQREHPIAVELNTVTDESRSVGERLSALRRIFETRDYWGRYRLYGMREVENAIAPFYFRVYMSDNLGYKKREKYMMVDDNSPLARQHTQTFLRELPIEDREKLGASLELARRKTSVRPSQAFTCVNRRPRTAERRRRADQKAIWKKILSFRNDSTDVLFRQRNDGIEMVDASRWRVACSYETYREQIKNEAEEAMFALASLHGRGEKMLNEVESMLFARANAVADYVDVVARNLDCSVVYRGVLTTQHLICRDATDQVASLGIIWLVISLLSLVLFFVVFCVWRYLSARDFKRREAEQQRLEALRAAEQAAEDARRAEEERVVAEEAAAARAAATVARAEARARQVSAAALNRQRTSLVRAQSLSSAPLQIQSRNISTAGSVRDMLAAHDQGESVEDTMWADTTLD